MTETGLASSTSIAALIKSAVMELDIAAGNDRPSFLKALSMETKNAAEGGCAPTLIPYLRLSAGVVNVVFLHRQETNLLDRLGFGNLCLP
jgi:hypothetical protein